MLACDEPCRAGPLGVTMPDAIQPRTATGARVKRKRPRRRKGVLMTREELTRRLELLRVEHRDLDSAIVALNETPMPDQLAIARLKKRKLRLRDEISWIEDNLVPDIIA